MEWFEKTLCQVHLDMHMPPFPEEALAKFNAKKFIQILNSAQVEAAVVFAKDHFGMSFYPTEHGYPHPAMKRDILGELLEEGNRKGLKMLVYYSAGWDRKTADEHPDWITVNAKNERVGENEAWAHLCFNSPYISEMLVPQIKEIAQNYLFQGFFFDIVFLPDNACFCNYCREIFRERFSLELKPSDIDRYQQEFAQFRVETISKFVKKMHQVIKGMNPELLIGHNGPPQLIPDRRITEWSDFVVIESQPVLPGGYHGHSIRSRAARSIGKPFQGITVRFNEGWGQFSLKETCQLKQEFASIAINGGKVSCGDQMNVDGTLESGAWKRIGEAFSFLSKRREHFLDFSPPRYIALIGDEKFAFPHASYEIMPQVLGGHKMLNEGHFQFDILTKDNLESLFSDYRCLVIAEQIRFSVTQRERIKDFVREGGQIVLFGDCLESFSDPAGNSELLGVKSCGAAPFSLGYIKPEKKYRESLEDMLLYLPEKFYRLELTTAKKVAGYICPITERVPRLKEFRAAPPPGKDLGLPAIVKNKYGLGTVLYFAAPIFKCYWENNYIWLRQLFVNVMSDFLRAIPYRVLAPVTVEVNMMQKENVQILHFVNYHAEKRAGGGYEPISFIPELYRIPVELYSKKRPKRVLFEPENIKLKFRYDKNIVFTELPKLHIHAAIRYEF